METRLPELTFTSTSAERKLWVGGPQRREEARVFESCTTGWKDFYFCFFVHFFFPRASTDHRTANILFMLQRLKCWHLTCQWTGTTPSAPARPQDNPPGVRRHTSHSAKQATTMFSLLINVHMDTNVSLQNCGVVREGTSHGNTGAFFTSRWILA